MVLKITVQLEDDVEEVETAAYTVHVESHRILSVATFSDVVATKWLKETLKLTKSAALLVGVTAEIRRTWRWDKPDHPYSMLCLSIGSHTLLYQYFYDSPARALVAFFKNPRVFAVGRGMKKMAEKLKAVHGIEILNAVDVNDLAVRGLGREDLDLGRYDLNQLAMAVLGKEMDVVRPKDEYEWYDEGGYGLTLTCRKVKFSTVDVYLCFLIGMELIDAVDGADGGVMKKKKKNRKNKKIK